MTEDCFYPLRQIINRQAAVQGSLDQRDLGLQTGNQNLDITRKKCLICYDSRKYTMKFYQKINAR